MTRKILLAGAAGALALAGVAFAQTNDQQTTQNMPATSSSSAVNDADRSATGADTYGADTAAQTDDYASAGERG